jgi:hypothetical protein
MSWAQRLQERWKVKNAFQVVIILLVFACTGFSVLFLKRPLFAYLFPDGIIPSGATIVYYILILPVYNLILLFYGFIFGQFEFFWNFEKRFFDRIFSIFKRKD